MVHQRVGLADQGVKVAIFLKPRNAIAARHRDRTREGAGSKGLSDPNQRLFRPVRSDAGKQDNEFIPAPAGNDIGFPQVLLKVTRSISTRSAFWFPTSSLIFLN